MTLKSIPSDFARDWVLPDGQARVQVNPKPEAHTPQGLRTFVRQVSAIAPNAGGSAVTIVATADTIVGAFRSAAIYAVVAIALILLGLLRRVLDAALVMAPLLLSALLTLLIAVLLPLPLNFANIIALPLLLGVGVSFNIYFVMNWRAGQQRSARQRDSQGDPVLGFDHRHGVWIARAVGSPGNGQHGQVAADQPGLHAAGQPGVHPGAAGKRRAATSVTAV